MTKFTQTHRVRPGRLAARLRVNVLLVISGLATSPLLVPPPSFLDLLPEPTIPFTSSFTVPLSLTILSTIESDLHRAIGRASTKARADPGSQSVLTSNSR